MYNIMHDWAEIRRRVLVEGLSKRAACRQYDLHWSTLEKILTCGEPPGYRQVGHRVKPKLGPCLATIHQILEANRTAPPKQRHTATRIYHRRRGEYGYRGGPSVVRDAVRAWRQRHAEVFVPIAHGPEEAQADFGHAELVVAGRAVKSALFVMTLPVSGALFCCVFPRECTESFPEGHARAFAFFGSVPRRISHDNTRIAVLKIIQRRGGTVTEAFERLKSYYPFDSHFCLVRRPNEDCSEILPPFPNITPIIGRCVVLVSCNHSFNAWSRSVDVSEATGVREAERPNGRKQPAHLS